MKQILDADHPFFIPVWRRWATAILPMLWGGFEVWNDSPGWGIMFLAAGAYALYVLIIQGPKGSE
jgi:hypothetical protein